MKYFENINDVNDYYKVDSKHPLIDIRRYEDVIPSTPVKTEPVIFDFYKISFVKNFNGYMKYGNTKYTDSNGILYFLEPGQQYSCTSTKLWEGYQILVHPDIYKNHLSKQNINSYNFFSYDVNESLLLTDEEKNYIGC